MTPGTLHLVGTGPGAPGQLTLAALEQLRRVQEVWAIAASDGRARALEAVRPQLPAGTRLRLFPLAMTATRSAKDGVYGAIAEAARASSQQGRDVALLCLGDPLLYGTASRVLAALAPEVPVRIHPGIASFQLAAARLTLPLVTGEELLAVAPATAEPARIEALLAAVDVLVLLKLGAHLPRWHRVLARRGLLARSWLAVELGGAEELLVRLDRIPPAPQPYMSLLLIRVREP